VGGKRGLLGEGTWSASYRGTSVLKWELGRAETFVFWSGGGGGRKGPQPFLTEKGRQLQNKDGRNKVYALELAIQLGPPCEHGKEIRKRADAGYEIFVNKKGRHKRPGGTWKGEQVTTVSVDRHSKATKILERTDNLGGKKSRNRGLLGG